MLDCALSTRKGAIIEYMPVTGKTGRPVVFDSSQMVLSGCESITINNVEFIATQSYPDGDYVVASAEEQPMKATFTNNVFRYFPKGVFRHTTVDRLVMTGNALTDFGNPDFIVDPFNPGNKETRSVVTVMENVALSNPISVTITDNALYNIKYVTFVNIQSTRGDVDISNNICKDGVWMGK